MKPMIFLVVAFFALSIAAFGQILPTALSDRQQAVLDEYHRILDDDDPNFNFVEIDYQKLVTAANHLRNADKLFPKNKPESRDQYLSLAIQTLSLLASKSEKEKEKTALLDECTLFARQLPDPAFRSDVLAQIRTMKRYKNVDLKKIETVEETLKLEDREWRNDHLSSLAQKWSKATPPNFEDAVRAALAIGDEDVGNRDLCLEIIATRQAKAGRFDDAKKTYDFISEQVFRKYGTLATFVVLRDEQGNAAAARKQIDELFVLGYSTAKEDETGLSSQFLRYCYSSLLRLHDAGTARYLFDKMVAMYEKLEKDNLKVEDEFNSGKRKQMYCNPRDYSANALTLAKGAAKLGDRDAARRFFEKARSVIAEYKPTPNWEQQAFLVVALFDAGFDDEAENELKSLLGENLNSTILFNLVAMLAEHDRFVEAISVAKSIAGEKERNGACMEIANEVRWRLQKRDDPRVEQNQPRKRFKSSQEVLDIAELMSDKPGEKSLELYRTKIRNYAKYVSLP